MAAKIAGSRRTDATVPSPAPSGVPSVTVCGRISASSTRHALTSFQSWSSASTQKTGTAGTPTSAATRAATLIAVIALSSV